MLLKVKTVKSIVTKVLVLVLAILFTSIVNIPCVKLIKIQYQ